ncbi:MAG TPA: redoxin domain-containing protein [Candidatus Dormibacteraeota bacterium]
MVLNRFRLLSILAGGLGVAVLVALLVVPRPSPPGTAIVLLASAGGDRLAPVQVQLGDQTVGVTGAAPRAPDSRSAARLSLPAGSYPLRVGGVAAHVTLPVQSGQVEPVLLAVRDGRVVPGGVYAGVQNVNLGLQELSGRLRPLIDFHLVDQGGRELDRNALLGQDTVIAAFHTNCRETCPLYTGLLFQLRKSAPEVRLLEVTTDPATDTPATLAAYRSSIGADWSFATGAPADITEFWAPFGVLPASGDTHTSALALVDRYGFIRAAFTGVPDVGGRVPPALDQQLDAPGRALLSGHGEGWGAPQVVDSLRTMAAAASTSAGTRAPAFVLPALDGSRMSLEEVRGRPAIVNFWWSGCPPCREEMPLLQRYADAHPDVALVLIDPVDGAGSARAFTSAMQVHAPVMLDSDGRVAAAYGVAAYPTSVFVRSDGTVASRYPGALSQELLAAHMSNLSGS